MGDTGTATQELYQDALEIYSNYQHAPPSPLPPGGKEPSPTVEDTALALLSPTRSLDSLSSSGKQRRSSQTDTPPAPSLSTATRVCAAGRVDVLSSLSSLQVQRGCVADGLKTKEEEVTGREESGVMTRALGVSLWELGVLYVESMKEMDGGRDRVGELARRAHLCRVKAIHALTCVHDAKHRRVVKYTQQHAALNEVHAVHLKGAPGVASKTEGAP